MRYRLAVGLAGDASLPSPASRKIHRSSTHWHSYYAIISTHATAPVTFDTVATDLSKNGVHQALA
jgi:hypothetical protein